MLDATAAGVYVIAVTPFLDDGRLDEASTDRMVDFYAGCGATGLTILGIMGEAPKLDTAEAIALRPPRGEALGQDARHRRRVVAGLCRHAGAGARRHGGGAAGVMIAPPGTLRTDDQIATYFAQAVEAIGADVPFVIQDYPQGSGVVMSVGTIRRIVEAQPSCVMLKAEDWPGLEKITAVRRLMADRTMRPISILTGNGGVFLDFEMERGADGAMTGYAFPDMLVDVVRLQKAGERDRAHDLFDAHLPLMRYEQQPGVGLAVRKHILKLRGAIASDAQRKPATSLSTDRPRRGRLPPRPPRPPRQARRRPRRLSHPGALCPGSISRLAPAIVDRWIPATSAGMTYDLCRLRPAAGGERQHLLDQPPRLGEHGLLARADRAQHELRHARIDILGHARDDRLGIADGEVARGIAPGALLVGLHAPLHGRVRRACRSRRESSRRSDRRRSRARPPRRPT